MALEKAGKLREFFPYFVATLVDYKLDGTVVTREGHVEHMEEEDLGGTVRTRFTWKHGSSSIVECMLCVDEAFYCL